MPENIRYIKTSFWDEKKVKRLFQELPFYNVPIEKPCIKRLNNLDFLHELPLYNELGIVKTVQQLVNQVLKTCWKTY